MSFYGGISSIDFEFDELVGASIRQSVPSQGTVDIARFSALVGQFSGETSMTREKFEEILGKSISLAIANAEVKLGRELPRNVRLLVKGWEKEAPSLTVEGALNELYLNESEFYRIIDVGVIRVVSEVTMIVARRSGHSPSAFESTWNQPPGFGPFKQIIFDEIEIV